MPRDVLEVLEAFLSDDPGQWGKLSSTIQWRRLQLLALRGILVELRLLRGAMERQGAPPGSAASLASPGSDQPRS